MLCFVSYLSCFPWFSSMKLEDRHSHTVETDAFLTLRLLIRSRARLLSQCSFNWPGMWLYQVAPVENLPQSTDFIYFSLEDLTQLLSLNQAQANHLFSWFFRDTSLLRYCVSYFCTKRCRKFSLQSLRNLVFYEACCTDPKYCFLQRYLCGSASVLWQDNTSHRG